MLAVEILVFVVIGGGSTYWGPLFGAAILNAIPEVLRALREWLELVPVAWTNFYPMNQIYDFLHDFLDFENAKRLIAYGIILIVMMVFRPDGLVTRDSLRWLHVPRWKLRHA
jgi:branched-chain amino acid transport system permease protein